MLDASLLFGLFLILHRLRVIFLLIVLIPPHSRQLNQHGRQDVVHEHLEVVVQLPTLHGVIVRFLSSLWLHVHKRPCLDTLLLAVGVAAARPHDGQQRFAASSGQPRADGALLRVEPPACGSEPSRGDVCVDRHNALLPVEPKLLAVLAGVSAEAQLEVCVRRAGRAHDRPAVQHVTMCGEVADDEEDAVVLRHVEALLHCGTAPRTPLWV
mmetsp:Transcript_20912/g.41441  ORF Transcript_20912/g.41441 Transcript_20912/m.41441 type:complete len:211 (+) Transcript_20912:600-1232(+)